MISDGMRGLREKQTREANMEAGFYEAMNGLPRQDAGDTYSSHIGNGQHNHERDIAANARKVGFEKGLDRKYLGAFTKMGSHYHSLLQDSDANPKSLATIESCVFGFEAAYDTAVEVQKTRHDDGHSSPNYVKTIFEEDAHNLLDALEAA